jgi:SAM-dependent methyltransferase
LSLYARDLAYVHDAGFGGFARDAGPGLLRRLRRAGIHDGLVVDLGCGSGIWARALTDAGYDVFGVDQSEEMLRLARRAAPAARFERASVLDVLPPPCEAITALGEVLSYADGVPEVFASAAHCLRPGGLLLFDVATPARTRTAGRTFFEGEDWVLCNDVRGDAAHRALTRGITVFRRAGRTWRRSDETHTLRLYDPDAVLADLDDAGFDATRIRSYGRELKPLPGLACFAARRR